MKYHCDPGWHPCDEGTGFTSLKKFVYSHSSINSAFLCARDSKRNIVHVVFLQSIIMKFSSHSVVVLSALLAMVSGITITEALSISPTPLDAAARATIRAETMANWSSARAANQAAASSAKGNDASVNAKLRANVNATLEANKAARNAAIQKLTQKKSSSSTPQSKLSLLRSTRLARKRQ